ncbi:MAG TPA: GGDEF domain-containing protein [Lachnospiraceae bacterium]|nr:GGDEF domain-containing protein [Lachnospiraceae bacterium]
MRRRIGVFIGEVFGEYQKRVLQSIFSKAKELDYDVFVYASFGAYGDNLLYAEGEESMLVLPDVSCLDGIIVGEDTFDIAGMDKMLENRLRQQASCPVVYLKTPKEGFYNVLVENREIMKDITSHFVKEHGFTDICYMSGKKEYQDAQDRLSGFLQVMQESNIEVTEHMIFEGDYWREKGKEAVDWFMTDRSTYPQVIICANDYMAISICLELQKRGILVPTQVCISGFDNIEEAQLHNPCFTTAEVPVHCIGMKAVEIIDNVCHGRPQERVEWIKPKLVLGESCGCGSREIMNSTPFMLDTIFRQFNAMKRIVFMTTDCQDAYKEEEILGLAEKYAFDNSAEKVWICLNDQYEQSNEDEFEEDRKAYTDEMVLRRIFHKENQAIHCRKKFPRKEMLPAEYMDDEQPQAYLVFSIHYRNQCYGYMVMTVEKGEWLGSFTQAYLTVLANAIEDIKMHREVSGLEEIRELYLIDSLTGIYNRRGYEKKLRIINETIIEKRITLQSAMDTDKYISMVSIDMDGLKYINDNFGHAEGDDALKRLAGVLKRLAGKDEVYARTGGDEFSMILLSDTRKRHEDFENIFLKAMAEEETKVKKPYPFHASVGLCLITEKRDISLMKCILTADEKMYMQKRKYKLSRKAVICVEDIM